MERKYVVKVPLKGGDIRVDLVFRIIIASNRKGETLLRPTNKGFKSKLII